MGVVGRLVAYLCVVGVLKDSQILMTPDHYIMEANKANLRLSNVPDTSLDIPSDKNLEVGGGVVNTGH